MTRLFHTTAIIVLTFLVAGACSCSRQRDARSAETHRLLTTIDDSVAVFSPSAPRMISQALAQATDSIDYYDVLLRRAKYFLVSQTPDSMLPVADRVIRFASSQKPTRRINGIKALALEFKADYFQRLRSSRQAIRLHQKAYQALIKSDDTAMLPELCGNTADCYVQMGDLPQAAAWYRRALFLVDSLQLPATKNITLYLGLANIYMNLEDYERSLQYYQLTAPFYEQMSANMQLYYENNLGNYYYYRAQYHDALRQFRRMEALLRRLGDDGIDMATCRINLADVYLNLDSLEQARRYVEPAARFFEQNGIDVAVYYANSIRIGMAVRQGQPDSVEAILGSEHFRQPGEYNLVSIRNRYLRQYYRQTGNYRAALDNYEADIAARDSITRHNQHMRTSEVMQQLREDTLKLHHQLAMQQKDKMVQMSWTVSAALLLVAILAVALWAMWQHRRRLQTRLDMMMLRLENARNRISPHFIFNVLSQHISSAGEKEAEQLMMLTRLIRTNLDISRQPVVTLKDEMDFVRYYLDVEQTMMPGGFELHIDAPAADVLQTICVPSMFVQIIVENAIKHGLRPLSQHRRLDIRISTGEGGTDITVDDNGPGFDIRQTAAGHTRTGLDIIRHTIRIVNEHNHGPRISFHISNQRSDKGDIAGCRASLHLDNNLKLTRQ